MKWQVQISGDTSDLESLRDITNGLDIQIIENGSTYYLESAQFLSCTDPHEVFEIAEKIGLVLSGAAKLGYGARSQLLTSHVYKVHDDGTKEGFVFLQDSISIRCSVGMAVVTTEGENGTITYAPVDPVKIWIKSAIADANVEKALRLYGAGSHDWVGLYRLYEVIEGDLGGRNAVSALGYASEEILRRFKHTANSPGAIGDEARHGAESTQPPKNPLPLHEAKSTIEAIFHAWLRNKGVGHA